MQRRQFIRLALTTSAAALVVACGPGAPPPQAAKPAAPESKPAAPAAAAPTAAPAKPAETKPAESKPAAAAPAATQAAPAAAKPAEAAKPAAAAGTPKWGGTLNIGLITDVKTLNVNYEFDSAAYYQNMNVFSKLINLDYRTGTIHADLADSWTISPDNLTYTFKLHPGVKWHDGKPLTSADVVWTYESILSEGTKATTYNSVKDLESITAPDPNTVVFKLKTPNAIFLLNLGGYYCANILPKHIYEGTDVRQNPANWKPIGTGPFKVTEFVPSSHSVYEAYPGYHREGPYLDKLVLRLMPNIGTQMAALEAGEIGYAAGSPPFGDVPRIRQIPGMKVDESLSSIIQWFGFNFDHEKLKDQRIRTAIAHAIDTKGCSTQVYGGLCPPADAIYSSTVPWAYDKDIKQPEFNIEKANALLDQAGATKGADGIRFKIRYAAFISSLFGGKELGEVVKQQLGRVGIDVTVEVAEFALFNEKIIKKRDFDLTASGGPHGPDPSEFKNFVGTGGTRNVMGYSNPKVDELFVAGTKTSDQNERKKSYFEIQKIIAQELPRVNLVEYAYMRPYRANYHDFWWQEVFTTKKYGQDMYNLTWMDEGSTTPRPKA